ncbi:NADPH:quinone reductase [Orrella daihaiensis]|uniref:NADPH:quinone reductase n=1 Tax=Orrella daihaiensis TaxID=2782176 RepID=A0ABY4ALT6_9BURK|nr:NADPH:quinone reductase [Orrella daihaiensis]UOD51270.1 NADPH:quinone reductase [Orrella daihaiensis]
MKAAWYSQNGKASEVLTVGDWAVPQPGAGEVLVRLHTSGVNPSDVKSRAGRPLAFDRIIPHSDGAGVVEAVGAGVDQTRIGQRVWIWNGQWQRAMGTCAEFIALPAAQAVALPDHVSFEAGACLGIPALTAWQAIEHAGDVSGKTVLIIGAANAVGAYCVQMAKRKGARVIGTVGSSAKSELAKRLGADHTVNYKEQHCTENVIELAGAGGVDVIIDMDFSSVDQFVVGGALKRHGTIVCYGSNDMTRVSFDFKTWLYNSVTLKLFLVYDLSDAQRQQAVQGLTLLLQQNALEHLIGERFKLEQVAAAHQAVEQGSSVGNVVIDLV